MQLLAKQRGVVLALIILILSLMTMLTIIMLERTMLSAVLAQKRDINEVKK